MPVEEWTIAFDSSQRRGEHDRGSATIVALLSTVVGCSGAHLGTRLRCHVPRRYDTAGRGVASRIVPWDATRADRAGECRHSRSMNQTVTGVRHAIFASGAVDALSPPSSTALMHPFGVARRSVTSGFARSDIVQSARVPAFLGLPPLTPRHLFARDARRQGPCERCSC